MAYTLKKEALEDILIRRGLRQSQLAEKLNVSREAVSKWIRGESLPTPDKLLRIGMVLEASFEDLVETRQDPMPPVVYFRKKGSRKTKDSDLALATRRGTLLKRLAPLLPGQALTHPPTLKDPSTEYAYVQTVADTVRTGLGLGNGRNLRYEDLIDCFAQLNAILIPVMWGAQEEHGNALNVYLPDSGTTWVYLNLDSNLVHFNFWLAHELGHSLAPELRGDKGEAFAEAFAQALLFPREDAVALRRKLVAAPIVGQRINLVKKEALAREISPLTIRLALHAYETAEGLEATDLGTYPAFMGSAQNVGKGFPTVAEKLFAGAKPTPREYIDTCEKHFRTPFFNALAAYCEKHGVAAQFIHEVLGLPLADAKALSGELRP